MVLIILAQVWFRYVVGNPLPWPDEAARFFMLWLTGLMAPTAFRRGGFVAINMFAMMLPPRANAILSLLLLLVSLAVLVMGAKIGWAEVTGIGGRFATASLKLPSPDFSTWTKVPRSWMMMSFHTGIVLLLMVNVELILRSLATFFGASQLPPIAEDASVSVT
jgi:TRAP-type C4-dicarboxylate transport system permease small subunit